MKSKEIQKKQAGITLVALVVTIIILIILATISLNATLGEDGLMNQAKKAKLEYRAATVEEEVMRWKAEKEIAKYAEGMTVQERNKFIEDQKNRGLLTEEEAKTATDTGEVQIGSRIIQYGTDAKTLVELFNEGELKIGDYVNYKNSTSGTYTAYANKTGMDDEKYLTITDQTFTISESENQLNWRVLGIDKETGGLKLIAGSPMKRTEKDPYFYLYGAKGYLYGVDELDKISALYKNELATKARSISIDDVNEITGVTEENIKDIDMSGVYGQPYSFPNHYTPEGYLKDPKEESTVVGTSNAYQYLVNASIPGYRTAKVEDSNVFNMLFDNTEYGESYGKPYWLASSGVRKGASWANFCVGAVIMLEGMPWANSVDLFRSYGFSVPVELAVRPVVILRSDVTEDQMQKLGDQMEEHWDYSSPTPRRIIRQRRGSYL